MSYALTGAVVGLSGIFSGVPTHTAQDYAEMMAARGSVESCGSQSKSGGIDYCAGYEMSCPDRDMCCSPNGKGPQNTGDFTSSNDQGAGWFNFVYQEKLGKEALRKKREDRLWRRLNEVIHVYDPTTTASATGVEEFAWDRGDLYVDPAFVSDAIEAAKNWRRIFAESRWELVKKGVPSMPNKYRIMPCQSDGYYSQWRISGPWTKKRMDALSIAIPMGFSPETRRQVAKVGWLSSGSSRASQFPSAVMNPQLEGWFAKEEALMNTLPGNRLTDHYNDNPGAVTGSSPKNVNTLLLKRKGDVVLPTMWFKSFIAMFSPKKFAPGLRFPVTPTTLPPRVPILRFPPPGKSRDPGVRDHASATQVSSSMNVAAVSLALGGAFLLWKLGS